MINENNNYKRNTIPMRTKLTPDIFNEMSEKYPRLSYGGREYKQNCVFFCYPTDFDFAKFSDDCLDSDINTGDAFTALSYCLAVMADYFGYYLEYNKSFIRIMTSALQYDNSEYTNKLIDFLINANYLYKFEDRITSVYAVRTFEVVQATRISKRKYKDKYKSETVDTYKNNPEPIETDEMKSFNATADTVNANPLF